MTARVPAVARRPVSAESKLAWALAVSVFLHAALAWRTTFGVASIASRGENGSIGAGGATFEVSVRGPEAPSPSPIAAAPATGASSEASPEATAASAASGARPTRRVLPSASDGTEASAATAGEPTATSPAAATTGEASAALAAGGTGDPATDSGRLTGRDDARLRALLAGSVGGALGGSSLGDVAILEAASRCPDPVAGTWTAHRYSPEFRDWARFTLRIRRDGDELLGTISTRMWRGFPADTRPPPCTPDGWDYTVEMRARGHVHGESFDFGAQEHHIAHVECASPSFGYNPDHFSGTFDVALDQLHTLNNDGGRDVNAAYTFRRSSCQP